MPNRIPTPGTKTPAVRKSPMAQAPAKPKANPKPTRSASSYPTDPTKVKGFQFGGGTV